MKNNANISSDFQRLITDAVDIRPLKRDLALMNAMEPVAYWAKSLPPHPEEPPQAVSRRTRDRAGAACQRLDALRRLLRKLLSMRVRWVPQNEGIYDWAVP